MCRLFAVRAERPVRVRRAFDALKKQALEHKDGWGIARFDSDPPHLEVNVTPAHQCARFHQLGEELATQSLITHIRLASVGSVTERNAHPFYARGWAFMHNGTVARFKEHRARIEQHIAPHHLAQVQGETDSETCFALFRTVLDGVPDPGLDDIKRALARVMTTVSNVTDTPDLEKPSAMNFLVTDGRRMVATRRGRTLFLAQEPGARFIASERLWSEGDWREIPEDGVVGIDERLEVKLSRVADWA
ncbi:MAG: class II glutamine amidotransferase [Myxococcaceae bacterium]|nr:class II glutamine amidotransferase [Myxococcaceae bacterium]